MMTPNRQQQTHRASRSLMSLLLVGGLLGFLMLRSSLLTHADALDANHRETIRALESKLSTMADDLEVTRFQFNALQERLLAYKTENANPRSMGPEPSILPSALRATNVPDVREASKVEQQVNPTGDRAADNPELDRQAMYQSYFESEELEPEWAESQEEGLHRQLSELSLGSGYITGVECRSTLCRLAFEHPQPKELHTMMLKITTDPVLAERRAYIQPSEENGSGQLTIYLARKDHKLPPLHAHPPQE
ncbi:MAG: hypothetical protein KTR25_02670 [Myxococcales bacterium]|nr:hypothetical protein [Myxococcales bacterium]